MTTAHPAAATTDRFQSFTAAAILAVPESEPERLFTGDPDVLTSEFRTLSKRWHPDRNRDVGAKDVFAHIVKLRASAEKKLASGVWSPPGELPLKSLDGKVYKIKYVKKHTFELGEFYIGKSIVAYVLNKNAGFDDLAANGLQAIKNIHYADDKLREEFQRQMPELVKSFETETANVFVFKKDPEMVLLADLRDHLLKTTGQPMDLKHVAWVMSRLHSLTCFLQANGLTHNAISADTVFVSPEMHTAALLGGWWYAAKENTALKGLPGHALNDVPSAVLADGKATRRIDLELVRATGRDLLGDPTGSLILRSKTVPNALAHWLTNVSSGDAFKDFNNWSDVLQSSFGARRFTVLPVSFGDVYQPT